MTTENTDTRGMDIEKMSISDMRIHAKRILSSEVWGHCMGIAESGTTYRRNFAAIERILFRQNILHGIKKVDTSTELFGQKVSTPLFIAPIGAFYMITDRAEHEVVEGAAQASTISFVSHAAKSSVEEYVTGNHSPLIWMGYLTRGEEEVYRIARQAEKLGYAAVGLTIDTIQSVKIGDHIPISSLGRPRRGFPVTPSHIERLKKEVTIPVVIKGIMSQEDAKEAVRAGADAVVVSNHGGRLLDYTQSAIEVLPEVLEAVGKEVDVLIDGGFRRGTDALKALAMGAKAVLIGRPVFWGVAVAGAPGVSRVIQLLTDELKRAMIFTGVGDLHSLNKDILIMNEGK
ncbi:MAG: hypothetical protein CMO12_03605 [Thaumarchaeota archaeon]|nr:hypothetical protein [Nitrososphaerota archaeon]